MSPSRRNVSGKLQQVKQIPTLWHFVTFCDVLWRFLSYCDVSWRSVTYCDVSWSIVTYCDVLWRIVTFCVVSWRFVTYCDVLWRIVTFCDVLWRFVTFRDVLWRHDGLIWNLHVWCYLVVFQICKFKASCFSCLKELSMYWRLIKRCQYFYLSQCFMKY